MKKILAILLALVLVFGMVACGTTEAPAPVDTPPPETPEPTEPPVEVFVGDKQADIVVIGAGGAGIVAAMQAYQAGATNVVILEQQPMIGGNTLLATGRMNAAGTRYQEPDSDSADLMFEDTMAGGGNIANPDLVRILADGSAEAVYWLNDNFDTGLSRIGRGGGASAPRSHGTEDGAGIGSVLMPALNRGLAETSIPLMLNTLATAILLDGEGNIQGVVAQSGGEEFIIETTAVVLATGGFGANPEMLVYWDANLEGFGTTNHVGARGTGIQMAYAIGANLIDMEQIQTHPTAHPTGTLLTEAMRGEGSILINVDGERFVNELSTRDVVSEATLAQPEGFAYMVFDSHIRARLAIVEDYIGAGLVYMADSPRELAEELGIDPDVFEASIARYIAFAVAEEDEDFGRAAPLHSFDGPGFYAVETIPAVHHTMGGVEINTQAEVISVNGAPIPGLFAAGEVTGGIHGNNRLGGNAITDLVVFGRIAGANAASFVSETTGFTTPSIVISRPGPELLPGGAVGDFEDGEFFGTGTGYAGELTVRVVVEGGNIVSIELIEHQDTPIIYNAAEDGVVAAIIATQSVWVDTVSGATLTSVGIMQAVADALGLL